MVLHRPRRALASGAVGVLHALALLALAARLGYDVGPAAGPVAFATRVVELALVAAVPAWLALRYRLLAPLLALCVASAAVAGLELAPPGPTFRDVAELERLAHPTGVTVVENGLYVLRYAVSAPVWALGLLGVGALEADARDRSARLPAALDPPAWLSPPVSRRPAARVAAGAGVLHAAVSVWFAVELGVALAGGSTLLLYAWGAAGAFVLAAAPVYAYCRGRLVAPLAGLVAFVCWDAAASLTVTVEDPHALYFGGWFLPLAVLCALGVVEYALRALARLDGRAASA
ncbi:MAG: hypothetical protein ABEJ80_09030 [Halarchaeum sp.]